MLRLPKSLNCEPHMGGIFGSRRATIGLSQHVCFVSGVCTLARFLPTEGTRSFLPSPADMRKIGLIVDFISGGGVELSRSRAVLREETEGCQFANEKQKQHICCGFGQRASTAASKSKLQSFIRTIKRPHLLLGQKVRGGEGKKIIIV